MTQIIFGTDEANRIAREAAREHRIEQVGGTICVLCDGHVPLTAVTSEWLYDEEANIHRHFEFGPASGNCERCGALHYENITGRMLVFNVAQNGRDTKKERHEASQ